MTTFADLATAAALGTANRPIDRESLAPALVRALPPVGDEPDGAASLLLDAAAAYALVRRARVTAASDVPVVELPPPGAREAPGPIVALLRRMGAEGWAREPLQREALAALAERGLTLPPDLLVELVQLLDRPGAPVRELGEVLDARGAALAALNPQWWRRLATAGVTAEPADARVWEEGTTSQQVAHLTWLRERDPAAGLALLAGPEWAKETAPVRTEFVDALATGLSTTDEAFLEECLDDRAKSVRSSAARLLGRLPTSALVARAEALVARHVSRRTRLLNGSVLLATDVPVTPQTVRDLLGAPPADGSGRARLADAIALVPTDRWPRLLGTSAVALAGLPVEFEGTPWDLTPAWAVAAERWRDPALATALVARHPRLVQRLGFLVDDGVAADALAALLRTAPGQVHDLAALIPPAPGPGAAHRMLTAVGEWLRRKDASRWLLAGFAQRLALAVDPAGAGSVAAGLLALAESLPASDRAGHRALRDAAAALQLRAALADALHTYPILRHPDQEGRP